MGCGKCHASQSASCGKCRTGRIRLPAIYCSRQNTPMSVAASDCMEVIREFAQRRKIRRGGAAGF